MGALFWKTYMSSVGGDALNALPRRSSVDTYNHIRISVNRDTASEGWRDEGKENKRKRKRLTKRILIHMHEMLQLPLRPRRNLVLPPLPLLILHDHANNAVSSTPKPIVEGRGPIVKAEIRSWWRGREMGERRGGGWGRDKERNAPRSYSSPCSPSRNRHP